MKPSQIYSQTCFIKITLLIFVFTGLLLSSDKSNAETDKRGFSLKQAVEIALTSNPEFSSVSNTKLVADEQLNQSKALYLPSLDLRAEAGYESTKTPVINDKKLYQRQVSLTMTQLLFDGAGTVNTIKRQKARTQAATHRRFEAAEFLALNVVNSFLNVLRRKELMQIAAENISDHTNILEKIRDGAKHGKFNKGDLAQAISRVARAKANFESVKQTLTEADASYQNVVGITPNNNLIVPKFDTSSLPNNVLKLIKQAKETNPALATFRANIDAAKADYKRASSNNLPIVELQVSGTRGEDLSGIEGSQTLGSAVMVMRWNLFRGGADKSRIKEAFYQKDIAQDDEMNALRSLEQDIRNTWAARKAAINQIKEFEEQVEANKKVVEVYHDQFKLNRRTLLDLLNTQNELFISESNYINALYSKLFADFRLIALRGDLLKNLNVQNPFKNKKIKQQQTKSKLLPQIIKTKIISKAPILFKQPIKTTKKTEQIPIKKAIKQLDEYYIQFGAFEDDLEAEEMLDMMNEEHYDLLEELTKRIQKADLGEKGIYYRLQAGPVTKREGSILCAELDARNAGGCFIVSQ